MSAAPLSSLSRSVAGPDARKTIAFVITEDWFFVSHFLPMARTAIALGLRCLVITRCQNHRNTIEAFGCEVISFDWKRGSLSPLQLWSDARNLQKILKEYKVDLVHAIALRPVLAGGLAAKRENIDARILAVTGLGYASIRSGLAGMALRRLIQGWIRFLDGRKTVFLFENTDDPINLRLKGTARTAFVGGAGIDPAAFHVDPLPEMPPLRVAIVARMLWSKGVDIAVEAVTSARASGANIQLSLFGEPDADNPRAISRDTLLEWSKVQGIQWVGRTDNVQDVWSDHHVACVPSRGGEGLPRSLLEAAACGRAIVASDVSGCRAFVRDNVEGQLVEAGNVDALAAALIELAGQPERLKAMGNAARARIFDGFREKDVQDTLRALYCDLLQ